MWTNAKYLMATMTIAGAVVTMTGCGGSDVPDAKGNTNASTAPSESDAESEALSEEDVLTYLTKVNAEDVTKIEESVTLAAPGSVADAYANYLLEFAKAAVSAGSAGNAATTVKRTDDGWKACDDESDEDTCILYSKPVAKNGKLAAFSVNGMPVGDRITIGNGSPVRLGGIGHVELLSSYKSGRGTLWVTLKLVNKSDEDFSADSAAAWVDPEGLQTGVDPSGFVGPSPLLAGSTGYYALGFPNAKPGGSLRFGGWTGDGGDDAYVKLKTR